MTKAKKLSTLLVFVQDETGSMQPIRDTTISAFNEYFNTLKRESDNYGDVHADIWQFSESPNEKRVRRYHSGDLASIPTLDEKTYRPRGITPLLDAVGTAIQQADGQVFDRYLFIVQTDGVENASRDFTREQVAKMVEEKEKADNWTLVFMGAGIANWAREAMYLGAAAQSSTDYAPKDTAAAYSSLARTTHSHLSSSGLSDKRMGSKTEKGVTNDLN